MSDQLKTEAEKIFDHLQVPSNEPSKPWAGIIADAVATSRDLQDAIVHLETIIDDFKFAINSLLRLSEKKKLKVNLLYVNYEKKIKWYKIEPIYGSLRFNYNEYYPEIQWMFDATVYKGDEIVERTFVLKNIRKWETIYEN